MSIDTIYDDADRRINQLEADKERLIAMLYDVRAAVYTYGQIDRIEWAKRLDAILREMEGTK